MNFKQNIFGFNDEFIDKHLCSAWVATAVIGAGVLGAGATIYGANKAAGVQQANAQTVAQMQQQQYQQTRSDLSPYRDAGVDATGRLTKRLDELTTPVSVNPDDFLNSQQYKFLQTQGERGVANSAAARGLAKSGAALKGAAAFESGLNSQQWQQNFNNQVTNQTNAYNRLKGLIDTGENASAQTGVLGEKAAYNSGVALTGGANAEAAADNATGKALSGLASNIGGYAAYQGMYGNPATAPRPGGPGGPAPFTT